jgi:hypothetical protein
MPLSLSLSLASSAKSNKFFLVQGKEKQADAKRKELSDGSKSDHVVLINAMKRWERSVSRGTDRQFCWEFFLSSTTLRVGTHLFLSTLLFLNHVVLSFKVY